MAWWNVIANGATIVDLARQVYTSLNKNTVPNDTNYQSGDLRELVKRLYDLEKNEIRQAELIKRMAEQMSVMAGRIRTATTVAVVSLVVAAISIAWQLLDK